MPTYSKYSGIGGGGVPNFPLLAPLGSATAPSYSFLADPNTGMFSSGSDTLNFSTGGTERLRITSDGQIGINTVPSPWVGYRTIDMADGVTNLLSLALDSAGSTRAQLVHGAYWDGTNWIYKATAVGSARYEQVGANAGSSHAFFVSAGGTAGGAISYNQAATITGNSQLLIGTTSAGTFGAGTRLRVLNSGNACYQEISSFNNSAVGSSLYLQSARGTESAPTATQSGDVLGLVGAIGYGATAFPTGPRASISFPATENWTDAAQGCGISFRVTSIGSSTTAERMRLESGLFTVQPGVVVGNTSQRSNFYGTSFIPYIQLEGTNNPNASLSITQNSNANALSWGINLSKTRGTTVGSTGLVQDGDYLGALFFNGSTSTSLRSAAYIQANVDGTASDTAMPGRLSFWTVPSGSLVASERMRIDNSGNVLINYTTLRTNLFNGTAGSPRVSVEGVGYTGSSISVIRDSNDANPSFLILGKTRSSSSGGNTIVQSGDSVGEINFQASDGTNLVPTNGIRSVVTGTPALGSLEGALVFTTNSQSTSSSERMRLDAGGRLIINPNGGSGGTLFSSTYLTLSSNTTTNMVMDAHTGAGTAGGFVMMRQTRGTQSAPTATQLDDIVGYLAFRGYGASQFSGTVADINIRAAENYTNSANGSYMTFRTTPTGSTTIAERMRIDASGNVGIGQSTIAATTRLHVESNESTSADNTNTLVVKNANATGSSVVQIDRPGTARTSSIRYTTAGVTDWVSGVVYNAGSANSSYSIATTNNLADSKLVISTAGNVGIGATPSAWTIRALQISTGSVSSDSNDAILTSNSFFDGNWKYINTDFGTQYYQLQGQHLFRTAVSGTAGNTITWSERMRIDNSGNVGVGTTSFGTSAATTLAIATGTEPTTSIADQIAVGSVDLSAGNTIPYIRAEGNGITNAGITNVTVTNKIAIKINGTVYYLLATTNAT